MAQLVVLGQDALYSSNGTTWSNANSPFGTGMTNKVAWNGSMWCAVGWNSDHSVTIATSTDGMTWTDSSNNPFAGVGEGLDIAWNGSIWCAVGSSSSSMIAVSSDGITWTAASNNPFSGGSCDGIAWNGSYWCAVGRSLNSPVTAAISSDGMTWTNFSNPFEYVQGYSIAWNGSYWCAVGLNGSNGATIARSYNGIDWSSSNSTDISSNPFIGVTGHDIAWNGSQWCAVGFNRIATSTDGITWTVQEPFGDVFITGVTWNGSSWYVSATTQTSPLIGKSSDGIQWNSTSINAFGAISSANLLSTWWSGPSTTAAPTTAAPTTAPPTTAAPPQGPAALVAVGAGSILYSEDATNWYTVPVNPFSGGTGYGIASNGSMWCAVGSGKIATSSNGIAWRDASNNPFPHGQGYGIAWNGTKWCAVGNSGVGSVTIATSSDGMTWTNASNNPFSGGQGFGVASNGSIWCAVGSNSDGSVTIATSSDGMTWTPRDNPFSAYGAGKGIAWNGSMWCVTGSGSNVKIATSYDAITWTPSSNNPFPGTFGMGTEISWNGSIWCAAGQSNSGHAVISTSSDGMTWTTASNPFEGTRANGIAWVGIWCAVGVKSTSQGSASVAYSYDGSSWTSAATNLQVAEGVAGIYPLSNYWAEAPPTTAAPTTAAPTTAAPTTAAPTTAAPTTAAPTTAAPTTAAPTTAAPTTAAPTTAAPTTAAPTTAAPTTAAPTTAAPTTAAPTTAAPTTTQSPEVAVMRDAASTYTSSSEAIASITTDLNDPAKNQSTTLATALLASSTNSAAYDAIKNSSLAGTLTILSTADANTLKAALSISVPLPINVAIPDNNGIMPAAPISGTYYAAFSKFQSGTFYIGANPGDYFVCDGNGNQYFNTDPTPLSIGQTITLASGAEVVVGFLGSVGLHDKQQVTCFLGNAPVATPSGPKRIDSLKEGDLVLTETGKPVAIQRMKAMRVRPGPSSNPYVIAKGSYGATEELLISPRHKVAVGSKMIEARYLGLPQKTMSKPFTYYNIELPGWANMRVAGVEVESLAPAKRVIATAAQVLEAISKMPRTTDTLKTLQRICKRNADGTLTVYGAAVAGSNGTTM